MLLRTMVVCALTLGLAACSSAPTRIVADPALRQKLVEVNVVSTLPQDEIILRAPTSGAAVAVGGLIGGMIESKIGEGRQTALQATIAPFYASVDDYDFRAHLALALDLTLAEGAAFKFTPLESTSRIMTADELHTRQQALPAGRGVLLLRTNYDFAPDFTTLNVSTVAELRHRDAEKAVYLNSYIYFSAPVGNGGADSLKAWGADHGARYRSAADEAAQQLAAMLKIDLAASATDPANLPRITLPMPAGSTTPPPNLPVLQAEPKRAIVRGKSGILISVSQ